MRDEYYTYEPATCTISELLKMAAILIPVIGIASAVLLHMGGAF